MRIVTGKNWGGKSDLWHDNAHCYTLVGVSYVKTDWNAMRFRHNLKLYLLFFFVGICWGDRDG